uniref:Uncharacterized protein n=1 Tax=Thermogladius calderae TaxID=1200300 RepID=A0A7J3Y0T0_9CREN
MSSQLSNPDEVCEKEFWKRLAILREVVVVILLILFVIQTMGPLFNPVTIDIGEYILDGGSKSWYIEARCWRLEVKLTSQYGDMRVTVVVDGRKVYDERAWSVDFVTDLFYGYHVIQVAVENPTTLQPGKTILVTGYVRYWQPPI